jgi:uncharacterized pyridoxal phosphate-containing UPF0001 family protein
MTMGPLSAILKNSRAYFKRTARIYEEIKRIQRIWNSVHGNVPRLRVAVEEGATLVRLGTPFLESAPRRMKTETVLFGVRFINMIKIVR